MRNPRVYTWRVCDKIADYLTVSTAEDLDIANPISSDEVIAVVTEARAYGYIREFLSGGLLNAFAIPDFSLSIPATSDNSSICSKCHVSHPATMRSPVFDLFTFIHLPQPCATIF